jgi:serine/threonine protein kinase
MSARCNPPVMTPDSNDDRTVVVEGPATLPGGAEPELLHSDHALPLGTRLGEFEVVSLVGVGGFGIVYLALDHSLGRRVALKEYMPQTLALRGQGAQVNVRSLRHADTFEAGRRSFVNEARLLAQFDHLSLVKVYRFWEANGTAYMVMPFYEGRTLKDALRARPAPPDQAWLERLLAPLLDALETLHGVGVYHRDIAPDNIMLLAGDRPLLLDFGAARRVISDMTQALTVILKPGYAPIEQYAEVAEMKQGAWTDIYALAAVVYFAITGKTPLPAVSRIVNDTLVPLAVQAAGRYSDAFLRAIDAGLAVKPPQRPQTAAAFRTLLGLAPVPAPAPASIRSEGLSAAANRDVGAAGPRRWRQRRLLAAAAALTALASLAAAGFVWLHRDKPPDNTTTPSEHNSNSNIRSDPPPPPVPPPPLNPLAELDRIFEQRNQAHNVGVALAQLQVRIAHDKLGFSIRSTRPGYLYVLMVGTDGQHLNLLFPNEVDSSNKVEANKRVDLPRQGWSMVAGGPPGTDHFVAFVSESPRDFRTSGLIRIEPFAEFSFDAAGRQARSNMRGGASPFLGKVVCPDGGERCSSDYGAAVFTIEEVE